MLSELKLLQGPFSPLILFIPVFRSDLSLGVTHTTVIHPSCSLAGVAVVLLSLNL